jgi:hypothetical protein
MKKSTLLTIFLLLSALAVARHVQDFSGIYVLKSAVRSDSLNRTRPENIMVGRVVTRVVQDSNSVEIVFRSQSGFVTYNYGLDGTEIQGAEEDGTPTLERAEIKGKNLVIRSVIKAGSKGIPVHRTQWRELSKDLRILTVHEQLQTQGVQVMEDLQIATYFRQ